MKAIIRELNSEPFQITLVPETDNEFSQLNRIGGQDQLKMYHRVYYPEKIKVEFIYYPITPKAV